MSPSETKANKDLHKTEGVCHLQKKLILNTLLLRTRDSLFPIVKVLEYHPELLQVTMSERHDENVKVRKATIFFNFGLNGHCFVRQIKWII